MKRADDFLQRREHLGELSDSQLHDRFWDLVTQLTDPLLKSGEENTSPAIERSVLLRMGFNSLEAKALVDFCLDKGLLVHGAGHVVYKLSKAYNLSIHQAGLALIENKFHEEVIGMFIDPQNPAI